MRDLQRILDYVKCESSIEGLELPLDLLCEVLERALVAESKVANYQRRLDELPQAKDRSLGLTADDWAGMYHIAAERAYKAEAKVKLLSDKIGPQWTATIAENSLLRQQFDDDYRRIQAACRVPLSEVERQRLQPSIIDKAMPWILVFGGIALMMAIGK